MPLSVDELNDLAGAHLAAGRLAEAIDVFGQLAILDPNNADTHYKLGQLLYRTGRRDEACAWFRAAMALQPGAHELYAHLATALRELGKLDEAEAIYQQALALRPMDAVFMNDLANVLSEKGDLGAAVAAHRRAVELQPGLAEAHFNLANGLIQLGRWEEAISEYRQAAALKPRFVPAHYRLGSALAAHDRLDEAIAAFRQVTALQGDHADAWYNLAHALNRAGRKQEAISAYRRAIAVKPDFLDAYVNLGSVLQDLDRPEESAVVYQQALAIKPDSPEVLCNLGATLHKLGRDEEAMGLYQRAVKLRPDFHEAWHNLGNAFERQGDSERALAAYEKALSICPDSPDVLDSLAALHYHKRRLGEAEAMLERAQAISPHHAGSRLNLGLLRLIQGDFERGFRNYEARWEANKLSSTRGFPQPLWDGGDLNGRRILLHVEQGLGDAIQFLRFVPMVQARGGRVIVRCWRSLKRLFTGQLGIEHVFHEKDPVPEFDVQSPLISLARVFGTTLQTIPAHIPYLTSDAELVERWRRKLALLPQVRELNVGLAWAGNPKHVRDRDRSIALSALAPLAQVPNVRFHSLQLGPASAQAKNPPAGMNLLDLTGEITDMADTAALIQDLDLVISVDTSVVHLAGALGKPGWVLLTYIPDWRWLLDRTDSPWYPTMRLFRQTRDKDWSEPIHRVVEQLRATIG